MENKFKQGKIEFKTGEQLRDEGIQLALENANKNNEKWSEIAFIFLQKFITKNKVFMAEDIREASVNEIPIPPNKRAWGGIILRAANCGIISRKDYRKVKNAKAHCALATLWESNF